MIRKAIVILANSIKNAGRCLAGKEVVWKHDRWFPGAWIRPVTDLDGAEVSVVAMSRALRREPALLDIVEMPFEGLVPTEDQPENWLLSSNAPWRSVGRWSSDDIPRLLDHPEALWGSSLRYVTAGYVVRMEQPASLYFIRPDVIEPIRVWTENAVDEQGHAFERVRRRVSLRYHGRYHELDVTDPVLQRRYFPRPPKLNEPALTIALPHPQHTAVCLSLTPEWHGRNYKIAAGFVEPELKSRK